MVQPSQFLIDLTDLTGSVDVAFTLFREAALDNTAVYYPVLAEDGSIDTNGDGIADLTTGDAGYIKAALALATNLTLSTPNLQETEVSGQLAGGSLYAPLLLRNGGTNRVYSPFAGLTPDSFQVGSDGTLLFEDGIDGDFDDLTIQVEVEGGPPEPPTNDNFGNRVPIVGPTDGGTSTDTGSNVGGTGETGEPNLSPGGCLNSVWWSWTAPSEGTFQIDTNGSDFDTFLSIFTGSDLDVLNLVGTDDNSGADGEDSLLQVNARAGQTFEIAVDGSNCETGNIVLNVEGGPPEPPTNDNFGNRVPIVGPTDGGTSTDTGSNVGGTGETGEPNLSPGGCLNSVWWSWTAPSEGTFQIDTNGSDFDTFLSIFTGSDLDVLNLVGTDDNSGADGEDSLLQVNARAGQTFEIAVDGSNCETGNIVLNIEEVIPFVPNPHTNFNQDLFGDILIETNTPGIYEVLLLDGQGVTGDRLTTTLAAPGWSVEGVGDFDGDGIEDDLFWMDGSFMSMWFMEAGPNNTLNRVGGNPFTLPELPDGVLLENLKFGGVGSFDDDGLQDDLIFYDPATYAPVIVYTEDGQATGSELTTGRPGGEGWEIVGVGNFSRGDQQDDLLWRNENGRNAIWFMDGNVSTAYTLINTVLGQSWQIKGVTDLDGDFVANDIVWQNSVTESVSFWFMEQFDLVGTSPNVLTGVAGDINVVV
jgi:hypothetical protein